jgi:hypothetical protein
MRHPLTTLQNEKDLQASVVASKFESLGGGSLNANGWAFGCEFGFFQRSCGIEPLGLLRWASVAPHNLLNGLRRGFEGVANTHSLQLRVHTGQDWGITQTEYGLYYDHSNMDRQTTSELAAKHQFAKYLNFLQKKFIEDLEAGEKIFVYRTYDHTLPFEERTRLANTIRSYGPGILLYVIQATEHSPPPFTVKYEGRGLMVGYIDHFVPYGGKLVYNDSGWEAICRNAVKLTDEIQSRGKH